MRNDEYFRSSVTQISLDFKIYIRLKRFFSLKILVYSHQNRPRFDFVLSSREEVLQLKSLESSCNNFSQSTDNEIKKKRKKENSNSSTSEGVAIIYHFIAPWCSSERKVLKFLKLFVRNRNNFVRVLQNDSSDDTVNTRV